MLENCYLAVKALHVGVGVVRGRYWRCPLVIAISGLHGAGESMVRGTMQHFLSVLL